MTEQNENIADLLKKALKEGIDYLGNEVSLQQARLTAFTLTGFLFILQILFACVLGVAAFILFNIAIGMGLTILLGNALWSVTTLGLFYAALAWLLSHKALRWLRNLKS